MGAAENRLFSEIAEDIQTRMERGDNPDENFITRDCLKDVWTDDRLTTFSQFVELSKTDGTIETLRTELLQTLSILVFMGWVHWQKFVASFIHYGNLEKRGDATIMQHTREQLERPDFLGGKKPAADFLMFRSSFVPIDIREGMVETYEKGRRLPLVKPENGVEIVLGRGGFGTVTKVAIARSQYHRENIPQPVRGLPNSARKLLTMILESL
jgi:hypothetical protein